MRNTIGNWDSGAKGLRIEEREAGAAAAFFCTLAGAENLLVVADRGEYILSEKYVYMERMVKGDAFV